VESGGETGVKADLCGINLAKADLTGVNLQGAHLIRMNLEGADLSMANLRGASLVRSNLQNANLLGTELRGANLMGANLYGAEGLWFGRLGGTNLFDAVLPESISAVDSFESHRRCHENRAVVLLSHRGGKPALLPADCLYDRRAAAG